MGLRTRWHELRLQRRLHQGQQGRPGVALVTGANKGIGLEVVRQLSVAGWRVYLAARNREKGAEVASRLGGHVTFVQMDVTSEASIARAVAEVSHQTEALDLLINNAGVLFREQDQSVLEVSLDILHQCWATNCVGPLLVTRAFLPLLRKSRSARVVNVSSEAARLYTMNHYLPAYSISKCSLNAVTRQLAAACESDRIAVNAICPGWVKTDMGGPQAPRSVERGAASIVELATHAPQDLSGRFIIDGTIMRW